MLYAREYEVVPFEKLVHDRQNEGFELFFILSFSVMVQSIGSEGSR